MINNYAELLEFLNWCIDYLGVGFHPDTDFEDYISYRDNKKTFSKKWAKLLNDKLDSAHEYCQENDLDIYEISLSLF